MPSRNYIILLATSILLAVIAFMSLETGSLWGSIIAGGLSVLLFLYAIVKATVYRVQIKKLAKIVNFQGNDPP